MCTNFLVTAADGSQVAGRSMENGIVMGNKLIVRGEKQTITSRSCLLDLIPDGLTWTTKYGYVGMNIVLGPLSTDWVTDGMNSAGLSAGMQTLPETQYQTVTDKKKALSCEWVVDWILGTCATVQDVIDALPHVEIWGFSDGHETYTTAHFVVFDSNGDGLVIELVKGEQRVHRNTVGVCTNGPTFDWHLTNIANYTGLVPLDANPITINGQTYTQPGHGSGLMGIPGDSTPPSRFIRIAYLKQFADQPATAADGVTLAFHLLNTVDIPKGTSRSSSLIGNQDFTQYVTVRDMTRRIYYIRQADNMTPMMVDLKSIDFTKATLGATPLPPVVIPPAVNITENVVIK